jgi:hypothetical protein
MTGRGAGEGAAAARTSTRPMVTEMVGADEAGGPAGRRPAPPGQPAPPDRSGKPTGSTGGTGAARRAAIQTGAGGSVSCPAGVRRVVAGRIVGGGSAA